MHKNRGQGDIKGGGVHPPHQSHQRVYIYIEKDVFFYELYMLYCVCCFTAGEGMVQKGSSSEAVNSSLRVMV